MTGSTHAREMISTSMNIFEILQLLQKGVVKPDPTWVSLLNQNKYIYMPIFNVDGVAFIEKEWTTHKVIPSDRKNMNTQYDPFGCKHTSEDGSLVDIGVDLNRNFWFSAIRSLFNIAFQRQDRQIAVTVIQIIISN